MTSDWNESWLTAYALRELNEKERKIVEAKLEQSAELRQQLEEIRSSVALLKEELTEESAQLVPTTARPKRSRSFWLAPAAALAAACLVLAIWIPGWSDMQKLAQEPTKIHEIDPPPSDLPENAEEGASAEARKEPQERAERDEENTEQDQVKERATSRPAPEPVKNKEGRIEGKVTDQTGAVIPGAEVTLEDVKTGQRRKVISNDEGYFQVPAVPPGEYEVSSSLTGFKENRQRVDLAEGETKELKAELQLGEISELTMIVGEAPAAQTTEAGTLGRMSAITKSGSNEFDRIALDPIQTVRPPFNTEAYDRIVDNPFIRTSEDARSTFSIDVDTASYSNIRRFLNERQLPPPDAVRIEEMINYFKYDYAPPTGQHPFVVHVETASAPWQPGHRLLKIALKGREVHDQQRPDGNFVFLIDVSGSMRPHNKLPLLKQAMKMLVQQKLRPSDRVAMVVYAGASGVVLNSTPGSQKEAILQALDRLRSGGSTNGAAGIQQAYAIATQNFIPGGINRVILATDGDFNVGMTNQGELTRLIEEKAKSGVFLTVLGFGMGNIKDSTLEKLADRGNGNYAYIDTLAEARKVLVEQAGGTLVTIAKDVKIQLEFNPVQVAAFRLIGYENRVLAHQDFNDDTKDAGEIGAGHTVTALYELIPPGQEIPGSPPVDPLRYQNDSQPTLASISDELLYVKLRYKEPAGEKSRLMEMPVHDSGQAFELASVDFRFAASVASFGMVLRDSPYKGASSFDLVEELAQNAIGPDASGYRAEFVKLVKKAQALKLLQEAE